MVMARALVLAVAGVMVLALWAGSTTFGIISLRNTMIVLRPPDPVPNRVANAGTARCQTFGFVDRAFYRAGSAG